jgi:hypothetical protein
MGECERCVDCGEDTMPCNKDGYFLPNSHEYYMVRDAIWKLAGAGEEDWLCIGCLEDRLGRPLTWRDNRASPVDTPRLRDRKARRS